MWYNFLLEEQNGESRRLNEMNESREAGRREELENLSHDHQSQLVLV